MIMQLCFVNKCIYLCFGGVANYYINSFLASSISKKRNAYHTVLTLSMQLLLSSGKDTKTCSRISVLHIKLSFVLKSQSCIL
jgi:hypothetical protein